jgi:hypothetical protein
MTHTPGPWFYRPILGEPEDVEKMREFGMEPVQAMTNEGQRYVMAPDKRVCLVDMQCEGVKRNERHKSGDAERDANARLIAAAPDCLAACKETLDWIESEWALPSGNYENPTIREIAKQLSAAIAKAEGNERSSSDPLDGVAI